MRAYVEGVLADERAGWALPFVTTLTGGGRSSAAPGSSTSTTGSPTPGRWTTIGRRQDARDAEIGATWLAASAQRTPVNTEAKLLMLRHAFDTWDAERITFKTDARNTRSRAAIERSGAHFEGIRRAHVRASDGGIRDSAYYSIVRAEWPDVRKGLEVASPLSVSSRGGAPSATRMRSTTAAFLLVGALRGPGHVVRQVDEPGPHLGGLGDRQLGDGCDRGLQLGERLVDDLVGRRSPVALGRRGGRRGPAPRGRWRR